MANITRLRHASMIAIVAVASVLMVGIGEDHVEAEPPTHTVSRVTIELYTNGSLHYIGGDPCSTTQNVEIPNTDSKNQFKVVSDYDEGSYCVGVQAGSGRGWVAWGISDTYTLDRVTTTNADGTLRTYTDYEMHDLEDNMTIRVYMVYRQANVSSEAEISAAVENRCAYINMASDINITGTVDLRIQKIIVTNGHTLTLKSGSTVTYTGNTKTWGIQINSGGTLVVESGATLTVADAPEETEYHGALRNSGEIWIREPITSNSWRLYGNAPIYMVTTEDELDAAIEAGRKNIAITADVPIYGDVTIANGTTLRLTNETTTTIKSGANLSIMGTLAIDEGSRLVIETGGSITNEGVIENDGTIIANKEIPGEGTISGTGKIIYKSSQDEDEDDDDFEEEIEEEDKSDEEIVVAFAAGAVAMMLLLMLLLIKKRD